jgi:iron(III) transport system ATP-binding protein
MSAIELDAVSKSYNGRRVVDAFGVAVDPGERVVLLGPSGCGKTTLLRLIAGLEAPDSGTISIDGTKVADAGRNLVEPEQRRIGMVFQDLALWPHMSVRHHLDFVLRYDPRTPPADRPGRISAVLEMVRMTDRARATPGELSGGEQQRVALARALIASPAIVLMDEPLASLDSELRLHLQQEILRLHMEAAFTLLYVTHSRDEAITIGSRVLAMKRGALLLPTDC